MKNPDWVEWQRKKDVWDDMQVVPEKTQEPEQELPEFDRFGNSRWVMYLDQKLQNPKYVPPEKTEDTPPIVKPVEPKPEAEPVAEQDKPPEGWSYDQSTGEWGESQDVREALQFGFEYVSQDPYNTDVIWWSRNKYE